MNYKRVYDGLIVNARARSPSSLLEAHHIVPLCVGGEDIKHNIVHLSPREHLIAHLLLARMHPESSSLVTASWMMCHTRSGVKVNSRVRGTLRAMFVQHQSKRMSGSGNPRFGVKPSNETCLAISNANRGRKDSQQTRERKRASRLGKIPGNKGVPASIETRLKISESITGEKNPRWGVTLSTDTRDKIAASCKGRVSPRKGATLSDFTKNLLKIAAKARVPSTCEHCGKIISPSNYARWHGKNCKEHKNG